MSEYSAGDLMAITAATYASAGEVACGYCPAAAKAASVMICSRVEEVGCQPSSLWVRVGSAARYAEINQRGRSRRAGTPSGLGAHDCHDLRPSRGRRAARRPCWRTCGPLAGPTRAPAGSVKYSGRSDTPGSCPTSHYPWSATQATLLAPAQDCRGRCSTLTWRPGELPTSPPSRAVGPSCAAGREGDVAHDDLLDGCSRRGSPALPSGTPGCCPPRSPENGQDAATSAPPELAKRSPRRRRAPCIQCVPGAAPEHLPAAQTFATRTF